jgi:hypothetical protein
MGAPILYDDMTLTAARDANDAGRYAANDVQAPKFEAP